MDDGKSNEKMRTNKSHKAVGAKKTHLKALSKLVLVFHLAFRNEPFPFFAALGFSSDFLFTAGLLLGITLKKSERRP